MGKKILLMLLLVTLQNWVFGQSINSGFQPISKFYTKSLAIKEKDSVFIEKMLKRYGPKSSKLANYNGEFYASKLNREMIKRKLDSIIQVVDDLNSSSTNDSIHIVKVLRKPGNQCSKFLQFPSYGYCSLKVKDTVVSLKSTNQILSKDEVYYFEQSINKKKKPKRK